MDMASETALNAAMAWRPLVTGPEAQILRAVVAEIVEASNTDLELDARADRAILHAYTDTGDLDSELADLTAQLYTPRGPAIFGGATRVGWTLAHLADGASVDMVCASIDEALSADCLAGTSYDLISGLVGIGVYALERSDSGRALLRRVIAALAERAVVRHGGLAWPDDGWNLGMAHGVAGVIALAARAVASGLKEARNLVDRAVIYLAAAGDAPYPPREGSPTRERVAWCYGDLGIASALLGAGLWLEDDALRARGLALARRCAALGLDEVAVVDATICHGAAGNAHIFNRLAQATQDASLFAAARAWLMRTLELRGPEPIAGFSHRRLDGSRVPAGTLLYGAPGVGVVFHAAISEQGPCWDRLFLIDLPG